MTTPLPLNGSDPVAVTKSAFRDSLDLLLTRRFGVFFVVSLLSNLGTWAQQVAQPWLMLSMGASSFLLGLDSFAMGAPAWALTLVGGVMADRGDRRRIIATFQSIQMLCPIALVILLLAGMARPWMVIVLSLVVGITDALSLPSYQTIVPSLVEREKIGAGLALNATQFNLSRILGPALAGVMMASLGAIWCFALNALSYLPFILVALWVLPRGAATGAPKESAERGRMFEGLREIRDEPRLRLAIMMVFVTALFCGPLITFSPVLVRDAFQGDVTHFSAMIGAFGIGGLVGALLLMGIAPGRDRRRINIAFAAADAILVGLTAADPWLWGLPGLLALAGLAMTVANTSANTFLQSVASPALRGQSVSLFMLAMRGGLSIGGLLTGESVMLLGVREALMLNALLGLVAIAAIGTAWMRTAPPPVAETT